MIYDVIQLLAVLIKKLAFLNKPLQGVYCIFNKVPAKKGELLFLLPHPVNFNAKMKP